jgi:hypothetical protein
MLSEDWITCLKRLRQDERIHPIILRIRPEIFDGGQSAFYFGSIRDIRQYSFPDVEIEWIPCRLSENQTSETTIT